MSEMFSRRAFLRGLGVVAAAAALTACSSTNEAVNQALVEGAVGGLVTTNCHLNVGRWRHSDSNIVTYYFKAQVTLTNVGTKTMKVSADNFTTTLDGTQKAIFQFGFADGENTWRTADLVLIKPGEEYTLVLEYEISEPLYNDWYKTSHDVSVTFTCGNQRVTYTKNSRSDEITVSDIETL